MSTVHIERCPDCGAMIGAGRLYEHQQREHPTSKIGHPWYSREEGDAFAIDPTPPLEEFFQKLAAAQIDLPESAAKLLRDHAWELYGESSSTTPPRPTWSAAIQQDLEDRALQGDVFVEAALAELSRRQQEIETLGMSEQQQTCATCKHNFDVKNKQSLTHQYRTMCDHPNAVDANKGAMMMTPWPFGCILHEGGQPRVTLPAPPKEDAREKE